MNSLRSLCWPETCSSHSPVSAPQGMSSTVCNSVPLGCLVMKQVPSVQACIALSPQGRVSSAECEHDLSSLLPLPHYFLANPVGSAFTGQPRGLSHPSAPACCSRVSTLSLLYQFSLASRWTLEYAMSLTVRGLMALLSWSPPSAHLLPLSPFLPSQAHLSTFALRFLL